MKNLKAIDIGCGAGILSESLARLGIGNVTGVDPTDKCVQLAQDHLDQYSRELKPRIKYVNTTLENVVTENQSTPHDQLYDLVCCSEVVEHVDNQREFLLNCLKLVKPNTGHLFVSTIAKTFEGWFLTIALGEYVTRMLPMGTHEWKQYINIEDLESILRSNGG